MLHFMCECSCCCITHEMCYMLCVLHFRAAQPLGRPGFGKPISEGASLYLGGAPSGGGRSFEGFDLLPLGSAGRMGLASPPAVSSYNFGSQKFRTRVSNPISKYI